jgi:hypothetical protein
MLILASAANLANDLAPNGDRNHVLGKITPRVGCCTGSDTGTDLPRSNDLSNCVAVSRFLGQDKIGQDENGALVKHESI